MITGWIMQALATMVAFFVGLLPHPAMPAWFGSTPTWLTTAITAANQMGGWFPLDAIRLSAAFLLVCWVAAIAIKVGRIVLSFITFGGGSAA